MQTNTPPRDEELYGLLDFLRRAEALKSTMRTTWTRTGRQESTAEHSWRLSLFAMLVSRRYPELDAKRLLELSIVHDLGEAINGDIPAPEQCGDKSDGERADFEELIRPLDAGIQRWLLELWEDYEYARTAEARLIKALDKLETVLQQAQGTNPQSFDYAFNLGYGVKYTNVDDFIRAVREAADAETQNCVYARQAVRGERVEEPDS
ncbi:HD domain-containing protein [Desulfobaculum senezii]